MSTEPPAFQAFTIGHSTRPLDEFIQILRAYNIALVIDVRTVPRSRKNPQFNRESLPTALKEVGIEYAHRAERITYPAGADRV